MLSFLKNNQWKILDALVFAGAVSWQILLPWYLFDNGTPARATVMEVWHTSSTINEDPVLGLRLEVQPASGPAFQVRRTCRLTDENYRDIVRGAQVQVRYDPRLPQRVVMTSTTCDQDSASMWFFILGMVGAFMMLFIGLPFIFSLQLQLSEGSLEHRGIPARATVIKVWDIGLKVKGNPRLGLDLHVFPEGRQDFSVGAKVIVPQSKVAGIYPGAELRILYDPEKPSRLQLVSVAEPDPYSDTGMSLRRLEALLAEHLISQEEYNKMRQSVLDQV
jgi:hypothetical protein